MPMYNISNESTEPDFWDGLLPYLFYQFCLKYTLQCTHTTRELKYSNLFFGCLLILREHTLSKSATRSNQRSRSF